MEERRVGTRERCGKASLPAPSDGRDQLGSTAERAAPAAGNSSAGESTGRPCKPGAALAGGGRRRTGMELTSAEAML